MMESIIDLLGTEKFYEAIEKLNAYLKLTELTKLEYGDIYNSEKYSTEYVLKNAYQTLSSAELNRITDLLKDSPYRKSIEYRIDKENGQLIITKLDIEVINTISLSKKEESEDNKSTSQDLSKIAERYEQTQMFGISNFFDDNVVYTIIKEIERLTGTQLILQETYNDTAEYAGFSLRVFLSSADADFLQQKLIAINVKAGQEVFTVRFRANLIQEATNSKSDILIKITHCSKNVLEKLQGMKTSDINEIFFRMPSYAEDFSDLITTNKIAPSPILKYSSAVTPSRSGQISPETKSKLFETTTMESIKKEATLKDLLPIKPAFLASYTKELSVDELNLKILYRTYGILEFLKRKREKEKTENLDAIKDYFDEEDDDKSMKQAVEDLADAYRQAKSRTNKIKVALETPTTLNSVGETIKLVSDNIGHLSEVVNEKSNANSLISGVDFFNKAYLDMNVRLQKITQAESLLSQIKLKKALVKQQIKDLESTLTPERIKEIKSSNYPSQFNYTFPQYTAQQLEMIAKENEGYILIGNKKDINGVTVESIILGKIDKAKNTVGLVLTLNACKNSKNEFCWEHIYTDAVSKVRKKNLIPADSFWDYIIRYQTLLLLKNNSLDTLNLVPAPTDQQEIFKKEFIFSEYSTTLTQRFG